MGRLRAGPYISRRIGVAGRERVLERFVVAVDVLEEADLPVLAGAGGAVDDHDRDRLREIDLRRIAFLHVRADRFERPLRPVAQDPLRERDRIFEADAAVAEVAARLREQLLRRRRVEVDVVLVREDELDEAESVVRAGLLPDLEGERAELGERLRVLAQDAGPATIRTLVDAGRDDDLRWPDFSDYRKHLHNFYEPLGYANAWSRNGKATPQALSVIALFESADVKGINAVDYDGSRWGGRLQALATHGDDVALARFDVAVTASLMRYISDLHIGRINPRNLRFELARSTNSGMLTMTGGASNSIGAQRHRSSAHWICFTRKLSGVLSCRNVFALMTPSGSSPCRDWKRFSAVTSAPS